MDGRTWLGECGRLAGAMGCVPIWQKQQQVLILFLADCCLLVASVCPSFGKENFIGSGWTGRRKNGAGS
jgi:hypothetical protein